MTHTRFLRCPVVTSTGCEHGFGTRHSAERPIERSAWARQVHGTRLLEAPFGETSRDADAIWTRAAGLAVGVQTADCVPLLIVVRAPASEGSTPAARVRAVAAVHAGWRGSTAGIAEEVVSRLASQLDASPEDVLVVIGPHIGPCCYEVDEPVERAVAERTALRPAARSAHFMLDLFELNRCQLRRAGVPASSILRVPGCTSCDPLFESYRRDGTVGRMLHYIRMPAS